jgi:hypothetical protein
MPNAGKTPAIGEAGVRTVAHGFTRNGLNL